MPTQCGRRPVYVQGSHFWDQCDRDAEVSAEPRLYTYCSSQATLWFSLSKAVLPDTTAVPVSVRTAVELHVHIVERCFEELASVDCISLLLVFFVCILFLLPLVHFFAIVIFLLTFFCSFFFAILCNVLLLEHEAPHRLLLQHDPGRR